MKPITDYPDPLNGAFSELISAMSSLNMEANPLPPSQLPDKQGGVIYLSESDGWAKHSMEHMHEVWNQLLKLQNHLQAERANNKLAFDEMRNALADILPRYVGMISSSDNGHGKPLESEANAIAKARTVLDK